MPSVYVVGGDYLIEKMFKEEGWEITNSLEDCHLVQYTGGADVSPHLYGEKNVGLSFCSPKRDEQEYGVFVKSLMLDKKQAGICRGAQALNVFNGGKMYQDVTKHAVGGLHPMYDLVLDETIEVNSTHHQQMRPAEGAVVVATADLGGVKRHMVGNKITTAEDTVDYEVLWYPDNTCLCNQSHPEYGIPHLKEYYFSLLNRYLNL